MISTRDIDDIIGAEAVDADNDRIGKVGQVYVDSDDQRPTWVSVKSGLFGTSETLVPLEGAEWDSSALHLAFQKDQVKDAPRVDPDAELSADEQDRLYDYYGMADGSSGSAGDARDRSGSPQTGAAVDDATASDRDRTDAQRTGAVQDDPIASDRDRYTAAGGGEGYAGLDRDDTIASAGDTTTGDRTGAGAATGAGHDTSGPNTDDAMTRSEERLNVGTQRVEAGRARLKKYVVTEQQTVTVPVTHDEVRIEREPITDANRGAANDGPELSEEEHEVVLSAERPVVEKETVPVERVRLGTEQVTENRDVTEDVRHEEITTDGDDDRTSR